MIDIKAESALELTASIETGNGEYKFHNTTMRDHEEEGFGTLTVQQVFEKSSNIGVAKMVVEHFGENPQDYVDYLKTMGLTDPLGFQMIGEGKPFIKNPADSSWSGLTLPWMSHGYELQVSPLQTLAFYNAVANNGKMIRPIIVKHVRQADQEVETYQTKVLRKKMNACMKKLFTTAKPTKVKVMKVDPKPAPTTPPAARSPESMDEAVRFAIVSPHRTQRGRPRVQRVGAHLQHPAEDRRLPGRPPRPLRGHRGR